MREGDYFDEVMSDLLDEYDDETIAVLQRVIDDGQPKSGGRRRVYGGVKQTRKAVPTVGPVLTRRSRGRGGKYRS